MGEDVLIFGVLTTGAVLIAGHLTRLVRNWTMHRTIREALSRDSAAVPELVGQIDKAAPAAGGGSDDRTGLVLIALALALALYGLINGDGEQVRELAGMALFPGFVGLALLGRAWFVRRGGEAR
jgi:hypothetical protein